MKKRSSLLLIAASIVSLFSCDNTTANSSSIVDRPLPITYDASYVYNMLSWIGDTQNYELVYTLNNIEYRDVYNDCYVYFDYNKNGGALLECYDSNKYGNKILYQYEIVNNEVNVLSALLGDNMKPLTNTGEFDFMMLVNDERYQVTETDIEMNEKGDIITQDKNLILILATVLGYFDYAIYDLFNQVIFKIDNNGDLSFTLQMYSTDGNMVLENVDSGKFENVGNAKNDIMENFISSYSLPKTKIDNSLADEIVDGIVSTHSEVTLWFGEEEPKIIASSDVDITNDHLKVTTTDIESGQTSSQVFKSVDGSASVCGIDAYNKPKVIDYGLPWNELSWPKDLFDSNAIRKTNDNTYHYFGVSADALLYSLTYLNLDTVKTIDFTLDGNQIKEMNTILSDSYDNSTNTIYHYSIKTTFVEDRQIVEPISWEVDQEENAKINQSFSLIQANNRFRATAYDFDNKNQTKIVTTVVDNVILVEKYTSNTLTSSYGWVEKNDQVIPFKVLDDKSLELNGEIVQGDTLSSHLNFNISSEVFTINEQGRYVTKPNLVDIEQHLITGPNGDGLIPDTLSMIVNDNGQITRMVYQYMITTINGQSISGTDFVDFDQYGTAKLTNKMQEEINKL